MNNTTEYEKIFGRNYDHALNYIMKNSWMIDSLKNINLEPHFALSIIFPELIRYSALTDKLETSSLFTLYAQFGKKYSDFSVGPFQMKPSFAEQLEKDYLRSEKANSHFCVDTSNSTQARLSRVRRLNDPTWQVRYLAMYIKLLDKKLNKHEWTNQTDRLMFYAAAYNSGYAQDFSKIQKAMMLSFFHTNRFQSQKKYCYSQIALDYYKKRN